MPGLGPAFRKAVEPGAPDRERLLCLVVVVRVTGIGRESLKSLDDCRDFRLSERAKACFVPGVI